MKKNKLLKLLKIGIILFGVTLLLNSCQEQDVLLSEKQEQINQVKSWFEQNKNFPLENNVFFKGDLNWGNGEVANQKIYIPLKRSNLELTKKGKNHKTKTTETYSYLFFDLNQENLRVNLKVFINKSEDDFSTFEDKLKLPFLFYNQDNNLITNNRYYSKNAEAPERACETYGVYEHSYDPNTGETDTTLMYTFDVCNDDFSWNDVGGSSGSGTGTGGNSNANSTIDDKIDTDNLDACSKAILEAIQSGKAIEDIVNQFAGENADFNWTLETTNTTDAANTDWDNQTASNYLTKLNTSYVNSATKLSIARTIIHEAIHAYILSYIDIAKNGDPELSLKTFPELWNDLVAKKYGNPNTPSAWNKYQHEEMARNYITSISNALSVWDNNSNTSLYYTDLAWGGLYGTEIYNQTSDLNELDRARIETTNLSEDTNSTDAKGNPCN
ncbi:hypothetical protein [Polaribacter sp. ALD11]|uniref:hypothetical protein n=1 Tax=Polaribacter sp. ALD11 TaxID=2058137 RepID=UPI0012FE2D4D|nr:hypothetical protein [Polaribacter sp. ALD11]